MIDFSSESGTRALERLDREGVAWLVTVGDDGTPQPSPIWFLWDGETALIYSQPNTPKVRNVRQRPQVALNLNSDEHGGNVVIFTGEAQVDESAPPADRNAAYLQKYREGIAQIKMTPESMAASFSTAIRFRPTKLRSY